MHELSSPDGYALIFGTSEAEQGGCHHVFAFLLRVIFASPKGRILASMARSTWIRRVDNVDGVYSFPHTTLRLSAVVSGVRRALVKHSCELGFDALL